MKTDVNGVSTCPAGQEQWESIKSIIPFREYCQYDYRHTDGVLFSTIAPTLSEARARRDKWLETKKVTLCCDKCGQPISK